MSEWDYRAVDAVVNIWTPEALKHRPDWRDDFFVGKMGVEQSTSDGVDLNELLSRLDSAGIEKSSLVTAS